MLNFYLHGSVFWVSTLFSLHCELNETVKGETVHDKKENTQVFLPSFEIHVIKLHRLLRLSQQAETRKAGKKPSFPGRREPGGGGKICLYGKLAPISPGSGPHCRDTRRENYI